MAIRKNKDGRLEYYIDKPNDPYLYRRKTFGSEIEYYDLEERHFWHPGMAKKKSRKNRSCSPQECPTCKEDCKNRYDEFIEENEMKL